MGCAPQGRRSLWKPVVAHGQNKPELGEIKGSVDGHTSAARGRRVTQRLRRHRPRSTLGERATARGPTPTAPKRPPTRAQTRIACHAHYGTGAYANSAELIEPDVRISRTRLSDGFIGRSKSFGEPGPTQRPRPQSRAKSGCGCTRVTGARSRRDGPAPAGCERANGAR
jgi:hypothetical protein